MTVDIEKLRALLAVCNDPAQPVFTTPEYCGHMRRMRDTAPKEPDNG